MGASPHTTTLTTPTRSSSPQTTITTMADSSSHRGCINARLRFRLVTGTPTCRRESAPSRDKWHCPRATRPLLLFVSMKDGWLSSAVGVAAIRGRGRFGGGEQRSSLYRLFNVEDRAKWEARSGGAFPKRAVRRLDENGRLPEGRAGCG